MNRRDNTSSFKDAFQKFLKEQDLEQTYHEKKLILMWDELMGKPIASRTSRIFIKNRIMYVTLTSAPLKQELTMSREKVMKKLEQYIGTKVIKDVKFL